MLRFLVAANASQTWNQVKSGGCACQYFRHCGLCQLLFRVSGGASITDIICLSLRTPLKATLCASAGINVGLANPVGGNGPDLAINGYAYDSTGVMLAAGQVPEPSVPALLALGALAFGAKGLRSWRKNRSGATPNLESNRDLEVFSKLVAAEVTRRKAWGF